MESMLESNTALLQQLSSTNRPSTSQAGNEKTRPKPSGMIAESRAVTPEPCEPQEYDIDLDMDETESAVRALSS